MAYNLYSYTVQAHDTLCVGQPDGDESSWLKPQAGAGEITLWHQDDPTKWTAFACTIKDEIADSCALSVSVVLDAGATWEGGSISPNFVLFEGVTFSQRSERIVHNDNQTVIIFDLSVTCSGRENGRTFKAPWSISRKLEWAITRTGSNDPIVVVGRGHLEMYSVHSEQPAYITDPTHGGIPLQLLRLFLPSGAPGLLNNDIQNEQDWIKWVARVCHGSQDPTKLKDSLRTGEALKQHWLRYQVWTGAPSFIGEHGHHFNLKGWITAYNTWLKNPKCLTMVNCFDQAGIVEIVLGFGIANSRLNWEVKRPFGFIDADLVGWGSTNSPFFEGDEKDKRITPIDDPKRTPFRSHVFISISPTSTYDRDRAVIVDACAGPVAGDKTYHQYLKDCALQDGLLKLLEGSGKEESHCIGVDGSNGEGTTPTLSTVLRQQYPGAGEHVHQAIHNIRSAFANDSTVVSDFSATSIVNSIFDSLKENRNEKDGEVLTDPIEHPVPEVKDPTTGATTTERKMAAMNGPSDPTYVSIQLTVFPGGIEDALTALQTRFRLFTRPMDWDGEGMVNIKPNPTDSDKHIADPRIEVFGNVHLSLFVYKNVLVQISGNAVKASIPKWTKSMVDELQKY